MNLTKTKFKHKAVMLIDDCEIDTYVNEIIIKKAGFAEIVYKHSGAVSSLEFLKNIEMIKNFSTELLPSVIFLDINMPILDGFQFLNEFNNISSSLIRGIKIIILSNSTNSIDIRKAQEYKEVVKFLHNPLSETDLLNFN